MDTPEVEETAVENNAEEKLTLKKLDASDIKKAELQALADKYANLIVTEETLEEADKARLALYRERIDIQRIEDHNKKILNKAKGINKTNMETLIAIIEPRETEITAKIQKVKDAKAQREAEEKAAEDKRIADHKKAIIAIENKLPVVRACQSEEELDRIALEISAQENKFMEFNEEGNEVMKTVLKSIENRKLFLKEEAAAEVVRKKNEAPVAQFDAHEENIVDKEDVIPPHKVIDDAGTGYKNIGFTRPAPKQSIPETTPVPEQVVFKTGMSVFTYGGFDFGISDGLTPDIRKRIKECIQEIIDDLPM